MKNPFKDNQIDVPLPNETTIGEINLQILHVSSENDPRLRYYVKNNGANYPNIRISDNVVLRPRPGDILRSSIDPKLAKKRKEEKYNSEIYRVFRIIFYPIFSLYYALQYLANFLAYYLPLFQIIFSSYVPSELLEEVKQRSLDPCFDFHHTLFLLAICLRDRVYFYDVSEDQFRTYSLGHSFHRSVFKISFRPIGSRAIAVGGKAGICVWDIPPPPKQVTRSSASLLWDTRCPPPNPSKPPRCIFLRHSGLSDFCWSKDGKVIVAGGIYDHRIVIWKLAKRTWIKRYKTSFHGGIHRIKFSPDGEKLLTMHTSKKFRVLRWSDLQLSRTWKVRGGTYVGNGVFSNDGSHLSFFSKHLPYLSIMRFGGVTVRKGVKGRCVERLDMSSFRVYYDKVESDDDDDEEEEEEEEYEGEEEGEEFRRKVERKKNGRREECSFRVCGNIENIAMDAQGERLAVTFKETDMIGIFRCDFCSYNTKNRLFPLGFIRGPPFTNEKGEIVNGKRNRVRKMVFWDGFRKGALLGVFWDCGKFSFFPFYYYT